MSNSRIIFEWLRDSFAGFALVLLAKAFAGAADTVTPFDYPNLYSLWCMIGLIPFVKFANWRRVGHPITRWYLLAIAPVATIVAFLPPDLQLFEFTIIVLSISFVANWAWNALLHAGS